MKKIALILIWLCTLQQAFAMEEATNLNAQLVLAAQKGELKRARELLAQGANPNAHDGFCNALARAAHWGYEEIVQLLIDHGADVHAQGDHTRGSCLIAAVSSDKPENIRTVHLLIGHGASVNAVDGCKRTPLIKAAGPNFFHACQLLIEQGAELDAADEHGDTALHNAAKYGADKVIPILLTCVPITVHHNFYGLLAIHNAQPKLPPEIRVMITAYLICQLVQEHMQRITKALGMKNKFNKTPQDGADEYFLRPHINQLLNLQDPTRYEEVRFQTRANIRRMIFAQRPNDATGSQGPK